MGRVVSRALRVISSFFVGALAAAVARRRGDEVAVAFRDWTAARAHAAAGRASPRVRLLSERIQRGEAADEKLGEGPPRVRAAELCRGALVFGFAAFLTYGEWYLVSWTLGLFAEIDDERLLYILGLLITAAFVVAVQEVIEALDRLVPRFAPITHLVFALGAVGTIGTAVVTLGWLRGKVLFLAAAGLLEDAGALQRFLQENTAQVTSPMGLLTAGIGLASGLALHRSGILHPLLSLLAAGRASSLRRRLARLEGRVRSDEKLVIAYHKAFDQGFYLVDGIRAGLTNLFRGNGSRMRPAWARIGMLVAALLLLALLFASLARAATPGASKKIGLLDLSASAGGDILKKNVAAIAEQDIMTLQAGDGFSVYGIKKNSFGDPLILFEKSMPVRCGIMKVQCVQERKRMKEAWLAVASPLKATEQETDAFGAIALAAKNCPDTGVPCILRIYSDMRHSTPALDFEAMDQIPTSVLPAVKRQGSIPTLSGVQVYVLGVHPLKKTPRYWDSLERFWRAYFAAAGAELKAFSMGWGR